MLRYCAEILALLPFTLPDEPLYLIYSINRVVQVRAGTLESNMKDFLNSFQGNAHKSNENGAVELDPTLNFVTERTMAPDGNQRMSGELQDRQLYGKDSSKDPNMNPVTSRDPSNISTRHLQKIQIMIETLIYLAHLDHEDTEKQVRFMFSCFFF
ncbi:hypothetical protein ACS0TY_035950 [Phlomoides rotata]